MSSSDAKKKYAKEYYQKNKDKIKSYYKNYSKKYYLKHKHKLNSCTKEYYLNNKDKMSAYAKKYYSNNKDKMSTYAKEYYSNNKGKSSAYQRMRLYGMSTDEYTAQYNAQAGCCSICKEHYKTLCVDHCHTQHTVRGLICRRCNVMIGMAKDSIDVLYSAIEYLSK